MTPCAVAVALVLLIDTSGSIMNDAFTLQRDATADASAVIFGMNT